MLLNSSTSLSKIIRKTQFSSLHYDSQKVWRYSWLTPEFINLRKESSLPPEGNKRIYALTQFKRRNTRKALTKKEKKWVYVVLFCCIQTCIYWTPPHCWCTYIPDEASVLVAIRDFSSRHWVTSTSILQKNS